MEKTDVIKKRFSDLIEDKYKSWKDTRIILDGGTGSGKTYFVLNKIGKYAKECNCKILYLCNRSKLRDQTYGDIKKLKLQDTVTFRDMILRSIRFLRLYLELLGAYRFSYV